MKFLICLVLLNWAPSEASQKWVNKARFENFLTYYPNLIQETIYEVEKLGWCNLKVFDQTLDVDETIYDRHFLGQVNFTNGFLNSIQHLDFNNVQQNFMQGIISFTYTGSMVGTLMLHRAVIGYDVKADFGELGSHKMTGTFVHKDIQFEIRVDQNLNTTDITSSVRFISMNGDDVMTFLPQSAIGEVISRHFRAAMNRDAIASWPTIINRILTQTIDRIGFPKVCFNC